MGQTFYKVHLPALSYTECRNATKNPFEFLIAAALKTIGISIRPPIASACPENLIRVAPDSIAPVLTRLMKPQLEQARAMGIEDGIWYTNPTIGAVSVVGSAFRLADGGGVLLIAAVHITQNGITTDKKCQASFLTELSSGRIIATTAAKPELDAPPHIESEYLPRATLADAFDRHRERLSMESEQIARINSEDDIEAFVLRNERAIYDFNVQRGVFVPVTAAEESALRSATPAEPSDDPPKSAKGLLDMLCWFSIGFGFFKLGDDAPNDAQLIFRWSLVVGGFVGLALLAVVRHFRQAK